MRQPTVFMVFDYDCTGNRSLLDRPTVAFFASREVSPSLRERALRWAEACCRSDRVVLSGFQSPLEKELFRLLLRARHPLVWGLGRRLYSRYEPEVEAALAEGRMLIVAVRSASRTGWQTAQTRNCVLASLADEEVYVINEQGRRSSLGVLSRLAAPTKRVEVLE